MQGEKNVKKNCMGLSVDQRCDHHSVPCSRSEEIYRGLPGARPDPTGEEPDLDIWEDYGLYVQNN
jgi:hypothetical protein